MKLGFYNEGKYYIDKKGELYTSDIFLTFIEKVLVKYKINAIGRLSPYKFESFHILKKNWKLTSLSYYKSIKYLSFFFPFYLFKNRKEINDFIKRIDVLFISPSGPLSIYLLHKIKKKNKKVILFIRQDTRKLISIKNNNNIIVRIFANLIESYIENFVNNYSNCIVFTFGDQIHSRYVKLSKSTFSIADSRYMNSDIMNINEIKTKNYKTLKLLYVGRIVPGKGLEFLIESLSKIKNIDFILTIVGDGTFKNDLLRLVNLSNIKNRIIFKGYIPFSSDLLKIYSSHDIFVMPSFSEGLPQVIFEAMSRGIIVVSTNVGGISHQIENEKNGFLFEPGDQDKFIQIINKITQNKYDLKKIRKNGLLVAKKFSFHTQKKIILKKLNL